MELEQSTAMNVADVEEIKEIINRQYQVIEQLKEGNSQIFLLRDQKLKEKEELLSKIKRLEEEQKSRNVLITCQGQLNPMIINDEDRNLNKKSIDCFSRKLEKIETDVKEVQSEVKNISTKYLADFDSLVEKYTQNMNVLVEKNDSLRKELHSHSLKRQTELMQVEYINMETDKIDVEMNSTKNTIDRINEENNNNLLKLENMSAKRKELEARFIEKDAMKSSIAESFNKKIECTEQELCAANSKIVEFNISYNELENKVNTCNIDIENLSLEINSMTIAIANKSLELEKVVEDKTVKLLKYNLLLKELENDKELIEIIQQQIEEAENLDISIKQDEVNLYIAENKTMQYKSQLIELKNKMKAGISNNLNIEERSKSITSEMFCKKEEHLKLCVQLNDQNKMISEKRLALEKLQSEKRNLKITVDDLQRQLIQKEVDHRQLCLTILHVVPDAENVSVSISDIIKLKEDAAISTEFELLSNQKSLDEQMNQLKGVTAECSLLTDKMEAQAAYLVSLKQEQQREQERERVEQVVRSKSPAEREWDMWSESSVEGAIPIQVAVRRYQQQMQRKQKRKNNE